MIIEIRFSDVDSQNHVGHESIVAWIAHARIDFLDGLVKESGADNLDYTLAALSVNFTRPVHFPGEIHVNIWVEKVGNKSAKLLYGLWEVGNMAQFAMASSVSVFFDTGSGETTGIPDRLRELLENRE